LKAFCPDQHSVVVAQIVKERDFKGCIGRFDVIAKVLRLISVGDGDEKIRGSCEELASAIEDSETKVAGVWHAYSRFVDKSWTEYTRKQILTVKIRLNAATSSDSVVPAAPSEW
jgi:hypothetical protein